MTRSPRRSVQPIDSANTSNNQYGGLRPLKSSHRFPMLRRPAANQTRNSENNIRAKNEGTLDACSPGIRISSESVNQRTSPPSDSIKRCASYLAITEGFANKGCPPYQILTSSRPMSCTTTRRARSAAESKDDTIACPSSSFCGFSTTVLST
jgi:hypothetical protein